MLLIKNGNIKTMAGIEYESGYVLIGDDGKIAEIGEGECRTPCDNIFDAEGRLVTPGLVEAHCHCGFGGGNGSGINEYSDQFTPQIRAIDGISPYSDDLKDATRGGITTVCTGPGSTNIIGGTFAAIKTAGKRVKDMIVKYPLAMKCAFGENPCNDFGKIQGRAPITRMAIAVMLREFLDRAKKYADSKRFDETVEYDQKMEAMLPVMNREIPLKVHVHAAHDIHLVLDIASDYGLDITVDHCTDGALVVDELREAGFPCFIGPDFARKNKWEVKNRSFATAKKLYEASVPFSIITDADVTNIEYLPMMAGFAVSAGLPMEEGWRAITVNPATQTGISDRVGSLEVGKDGDVVVWTENPLRYLGAHPVLTVIEGRIVYEYREE